MQDDPSQIANHLIEQHGVDPDDIEQQRVGLAEILFPFYVADEYANGFLVGFGQVIGLDGVPNR